MIMRVLSLDISAASTGWAFAFGQARLPFECGLIKTSPKFSRAERLAFFRNSLKEILLEFRPTHVVMEDVYGGLNVKTLTLLSKFAGVAEECCLTVADISPHVIHNSTVKAYFKVKNKEQLFNVIVDILGWNVEEVKFKKHNDLTDSIAQLLVYYHKILEYRSFREEKDYG